MAYSYELGMEFIEEAPLFAYGFECGRLWEQLKKAESFQQHVNAFNASQIVMMCEHHAREFQFEEMGHGWLNLKVKQKS
jgi:hypothetical protein